MGTVFEGRSAATGVGCALLLAGVAGAQCVEVSFSDVGTDTTARFFHRAGLLCDGQVLVSGGLGLRIVPPSLVSLDELSFFDAGTDTFTTTFEPLNGDPPVTPRLAVARSSHTQTALPDGRVLITGGRTGAVGESAGTPVASVELFDVFTGVVAEGPAMAAARAGHTATRLDDGRVVVAGGSTWQVFTPGAPGDDAWSTPYPLVHTRTDHAAVLLPGGKGPGVGRVLLVGGGGSGPTTLEWLDPDTGVSTSSAATLPVGVDDLAAARLDDGTVLVVGGQDLATGDTIDLVRRYDPETDRLELAPPVPERPGGIADHQLVVRERFAFVFGGEAQVSGVDTELDYAAVFDRAAGDWILVSAMNSVRDDFASAVLDDGRILLVDGGVPLLGRAAPTFVVEAFAVTPLRPPDLDGDGIVSVSDILLVLAVWGPCSPDGACPADLDESGVVDVADLLRVLAAWGPCE